MLLGKTIREIGTIRSGNVYESGCGALQLCPQLCFKFHVFSFSFFEQIFFEINSILREPLWEMVIAWNDFVALTRRLVTRSRNEETSLMLEMFAKLRRHSRKLERARTFTHDPVVVG